MVPRPFLSDLPFPIFATPLASLSGARPSKKREEKSSCCISNSLGFAEREREAVAMDSSSTNGRSKATLSTETLSALAEGIALLLSRWTALQMAIQNEWGGCDSRQKSTQLASDLLSWFAHSKVPHYVDDLENMLDEAMVLSFNTEVEDGSIEEVAEQLMIMHEECLQGHYESIENLRKCNEGTESVSLSRQVINDDKDESPEDEASNMAVDENHEMKPKTEEMAMGESRPKEPTGPQEGWSIVPTRRNRGRRC